MLLLLPLLLLSARRAPLLRSALLASLLAGCALPPTPTPASLRTERWLAAPTVELVGLQSNGAAQPRFSIALRLYNPNPIALDVAGLELELDVNGVRLARGLSNRRVRVQPGGVAAFDIDAPMTARDVERTRSADARVRPGEPLAYAVAGRIYLNNNNDINSVPFTPSALVVPR